MKPSSVPGNRAPIAIVGVSAIFPGSTDKGGFWRDIVRGADLLSDVPASHWLIDDYYDPDPTATDKTYARRGGFLSLAMTIRPPRDPVETRSGSQAEGEAQEEVEAEGRDEGRPRASRVRASHGPRRRAMVGGLRTYGAPGPRAHLRQVTRNSVGRHS